MATARSWLPLPTYQQDHDSKPSLKQKSAGEFSLHKDTMARFSLVLAAAGVVLLVALAEATTKTIITTTTMEENPTGRRTEMPCSQQMAEQQMLNHCMMYLESVSGMSMGRGRMPEPTPEEHLRLCCMQLTNIDEMCRCDAIEMMMNQQGWTQQQMGRMMGMAHNLPKQCKLKPDMCQMRAVWF